MPKTTQLVRGPARKTRRLALPVALACLPLCCLHQHWGPQAPPASRRASRLHKPSPPPHPHPSLPELTRPHPARPERRNPAHTRLGSLPSHTGQRPGLRENRGPKKQRPEVSRLGCIETYVCLALGPGSLHKALLSPDLDTPSVWVTALAIGHFTQFIPCSSLTQPVTQSFMQQV